MSSSTEQRLKGACIEGWTARQVEEDVNTQKQVTGMSDGGVVERARELQIGVLHIDTRNQEADH